MRSFTEQYDRAIIFARAFRNAYPMGKKHRVMVTPDELMKILGVDNLDPMPIKTREGLKDMNLYIRKIRGKDMYAIWWDTETVHNGRFVPKGGKSHGD